MSNSSLGKKKSWNYGVVGFCSLMFSCFIFALVWLDFIQILFSGDTLEYDYVTTPLGNYIYVALIIIGLIAFIAAAVLSIVGIIKKRISIFGIPTLMIFSIVILLAIFNVKNI